MYLLEIVVGLWLLDILVLIENILGGGGVWFYGSMFRSWFKNVMCWWFKWWGFLLMGMFMRSVIGEINGFDALKKRRRSHKFSGLLSIL